MKYILSVPFLFLFLSVPVFTQGFTDSNLPLVVINTDNGVQIRDDPRVRASMKIIYRGAGERNYISDQNNPAYLDYDGRIDIEIRGSSTQQSEKKQYGLTTRKADNVSNNNVSLLGMPEENDWILNGMAFDPAVIRDYLSYNLSRQIGRYAPRTVYCELVINGAYNGLYILQEKIKADDNRVDIIKIGTGDNSFPDVTGGYITKADKTTGGDPVAWTMYSWFGGTVNYIHELPKPENVTSQQNNYIRGQFQLLETTALNKNSSVSGGFPSVIDMPSFIDFILINELASNADAYSLSTFFHKDRNGKLRAGPVWDHDLTYGNDLFFWGYDRSKTNIWMHADRGNDGSRFWKDLIENPVFRCYLSKRWNELIQPGQPLNLAGMESFIDQTVTLISEAVVRENALWGNIGNHQQKIQGIKSFLNARIAWITTNLGSYSNCSDVMVPPLVITKIMYHPGESAGSHDEDDLEFIEITNNSDLTIDLTGIYFSNTGFVYQFPANSSLGPRLSVILASNASAFRDKYRFMPFGVFTRHLSNKSENLVLADAFGNVIDNVHYFDTAPWPDADGNGNYLKLTDANLDNSLASSWIASNETIVSDHMIPGEDHLKIYPNPVTGILGVFSESALKSVSLYDIYGRLLISAETTGENLEVDMSSFSKGIYIIRIVTINKTFKEKIIKK